MKGVWTTLLALAVVYCVVYAVKPTVSRSFQQRYGKDDPPKSAVRAARITGVVIAVLGAAVLVSLLVWGELEG